jgi:anti-sigma factor RsiW
VTGDELTEDLLSAYADDELGVDERAAVEARLAESAEWRAILGEVEETRAMLRGLPVREAPPAAWASTLATVEADAQPRDVDAQDPAPPVPISRARRRTAVVWKAAAGVAAAAVVAAVILVPTRSSSRPPVASLVNTHAARSSLTEDPVSQLAPVAGPVRFRR